MVDDQEETSAINAREDSKTPPEDQNPNKGFQMGDCHEPSSPVQMEESPSILECEMGAWQTNGEENGHEQSLPVQIPQMVENPPIQESEMGAWQTNGGGNAHEQSPQHDNNSGASAYPDLGLDAAIPDPLPKGDNIEIFF